MSDEQKGMRGHLPYFRARKRETGEARMPGPGLDPGSINDIIFV